MSTLIDKDAEEPDVDSQWVKKLDEIGRLGDPLRMYIHEIGNIKHLTAAHERWLARKMEEGTYIEDLEVEFRDLTGRDCKGVDLLRFFMTQIHREVPVINMICRFYHIRKPESLKDLLTDKGLNDRLHGELPEEMLKYVAVMSAAFRNTSPEEIKGEIQDLSLMLRSLPKNVQDMFAISPDLTLLNVLENMIIYKKPVEDYELLLKRHFNYKKSIGVRAKQHFTLASLHLVVSATKNYSDKGMSQADLIQEGNIGLLRAVEEFDYRVGTQFKAYASYWITQAMLRAIADQARTIRIPVYMVENINNLQSVTRRLERELGRPPTV